MFDAADRKKLILQIALLLVLDQKNRYYCPLYHIIRLERGPVLCAVNQNKMSAFRYFTFFGQEIDI